jgi:hypothetical protein
LVVIVVIAILIALLLPAVDPLVWQAAGNRADGLAVAVPE